MYINNPSSYELISIVASLGVQDALRNWNFNIWDGMGYTA